MKKLHFISFAITGRFALVFQQTSAKVWRVNNLSNYNASSLWGDNLGGTSSTPVFTELTNLSSVLVSPGDTVHVEGSASAYNGVTLTKRLVIIGPGFFLNENPNSSANLLEAKILSINFNSTSAGSQLIGVTISSVSSIGISTNNILIKRCKIDYDISLSSGITDIKILQNYFTNVASNNSSALNWSVSGAATEVYFNNNICKKTLLVNVSSAVYTLDECRNNVFDCPALGASPSILMNTASFQNNILKNSAAVVNINNNTNINVSYNIGAAANQFGTANNNVVVGDMTTLFVDPLLNTTDGDYQLKPGSGGSGNGSDNTDRGVFGGTAVSNKYMLSGLAPVPVIYNISTAGVAGPAGLPVTIKAKIVN